MTCPHLARKLLLGLLVMTLVLACSQQPVPTGSGAAPSPSATTLAPRTAPPASATPVAATVRPAVTASPVAARPTPEPAVKPAPEPTREAAEESRAPVPENDQASPTPTAPPTDMAVETPSPRPTAGPTLPPQTPAVQQATPTVAAATPTPAAATPTPAARPSLRISSPRDGSVLTEPEVTEVRIYVEVANFKVVNKIGAANVPGEGHIIYYRDTDAVVNTYRPAINMLAVGGGEPVAAYNYTWVIAGGLAPGPHTFSAQLVNNDMTSLNPPVVAKVTVTMPVPPPPVDIIARNGAFSTQLIEVNAGADVIISFRNTEAMTHNLAIYVTGSPKYLVFRGGNVGPGEVTTYRFKAPATEGYYLFQCDYHPAKMLGTFNVWPAPPTTTR